MGEKNLKPRPPSAQGFVVLLSAFFLVSLFKQVQEIDF